MKALCLGVVILGAGASSRMGRPKLLLPWGETNILWHTIGQWREAGAEQIGVVCGPPPHPVFDEIGRIHDRRISRIVNPHPEAGMFSSIQCAARWLNWQDSLSHMAISLGDQPEIRAGTLADLLRFAAQQRDRICQPAFGGRLKHPVILPRTLFQEIACSAAANFREFLQMHAEIRASIEIADPGLDLDIDTPADYERASTGRGSNC